MYRYINYIVIGCCISCSSCSTSKTGDEEIIPNILFCIADDASYPFMGAYGCNWVSTPAFDRVAQEGISFKKVYTPNAKCSPSRSCILTGLNSWQLEEAANHFPRFPEKYMSFVEILEKNGISTGHTGKGWAPGDPGMKNGKKRCLIGKQYNDIRKHSPTSQISTVDYSANFESFLEENRNTPWFFWYGGYEPHRAYEYASGIVKGGKDISEVDSIPGFLPDNQITRCDLLDYAFELEYFDSELMEMIKILERDDLLENTIIIVTADNGMPFPRIKGQTYEFSNHVPLAVMWKGKLTNPGRSEYDLISFVDFVPTLLEILGLEGNVIESHELVGKSFAGLLSNKYRKRTNEYVLIGKERHDVGRPHDEGYPIRGIIKDDFLLIMNFQENRWPAGNPETGYLNCDGSPIKSLILDMHRENINDYYWNLCFGKREPVELYNIKTDPCCIYNLAGENKYLELKNSMMKIMLSELKNQNDPRMAGAGYVFDNYPYAGRERNFYHRYMNGEKINTPWVNESDYEKTNYD